MICTNMIKKNYVTSNKIFNKTHPICLRNSTRFYKEIEFFHFNSVKNHGLIILLTFLARALAVKIESD